MERLYRKLEEYSRADYYPFHMPGHKRNSASVRGEFPLERDITEIEGFDNLHHPEELLLEAGKWEISHGGLTGRTAQQFINYLLGKQE